MNPISGKDRASACITAARAGAEDLEIGGPDVPTHNEIVRLAFDAAAVTPRVLRIPAWALSLARGTLTHTTPERAYGPVQFFLSVMTTDMIAPSHGDDHLADFFAEKVSG